MRIAPNIKGKNKAKQLRKKKYKNGPITEVGKETKPNP
jgi:hypothetical protein